MIGLFQALMPREDKFFDLFDRHAATLTLGARALRELLDGGEGVTACCARIMRHEGEADAVAAETMDAVRKSFITPFDRSDIQELSAALDDAIDQMQKTAKAALLFEVTSFEPAMREMGDIVVEAAALTVEAIGKLKGMQKHGAAINAIAARIVELEDHADSIHDRGLKALLHERQNDPMGFIVGREIYSQLEKVVDRFEDVAKRFSGILIEHL
jgi:predicted phosphate transport protein (TIGR00153 family)